MQIAFATLVGTEPLPFADLVVWSAANGIAALEVNTGPTYPVIGDVAFPGHLDLETIVRDGPDGVHQLLNQYGVSIVSLAPMINLLTADPLVRESRIAQMQLTIDAAAVLGVDTVVTFAGSSHGMYFQGLPGMEPGHPSSQIAANLDLFGRVYGPLATYAAERDVRIAFETAGRGGGEGNIAHSPELWDAMFAAVPSPALGLSFDPSHLVWLQIPDVCGVIRSYADRIYHFDAKDTEIVPEVLARQGIFGSNWWRYRLPGSGQLDWAAIISTLRDIEYNGPISIENEDPFAPGLAGVATAATFLRQELARSEPPGRNQ